MLKVLAKGCLRSSLSSSSSFSSWIPASKSFGSGGSRPGLDFSLLLASESKILLDWAALTSCFDGLVKFWLTLLLEVYALGPFFPFLASNFAYRS